MNIEILHLIPLLVNFFTYSFESKFTNCPRFFFDKIRYPSYLVEHGVEDNPGEPEAKEDRK